MTWRPGNIITANRLNFPEPETITSGLTLEPNFTLNQFWADRVYGMCTTMVYVATVSPISTTNSTTTNIGDTVLGTLPEGFRPRGGTIGTIWSSGITAGECTISDSGTITLRTTGYNMQVDGNLRIHATFVHD